METYYIYGSDGTLKASTRKLEYSSTHMGACHVTVSIKSAVPIDFGCGDYLTFRGEQFFLRYTPACKKQAARGTYGEAFVYDNMIFNSTRDDLTRVVMLDVVAADNSIHYTALPNFSFYCATAEDLAERIKANLDRVYYRTAADGTRTGIWSVTVAEGTAIKAQAMSFANVSVWEALTQANKTLKLNFLITQYSIKIGSKGSTLRTMSFGKGNGLTAIERTSDESKAIITRLRCYGNTTNIPYRYYNKLTTIKGGKSVPLISESKYMPNLMLPGIRQTGNGAGWRYADSDNLIKEVWTADGDVYLESETGVAKYGVLEGSVFFTGEGTANDDSDDIYPSMKNMTAARLTSMGVVTYLESGDNGKLDEIYISDDCSMVQGALKQDGTCSPVSFHIFLKDLGFNPVNYKSTSDSMKIVMESGMCAARTFDITQCEQIRGLDADTGKTVVSYKLTCTRAKDDGVQAAYPNSDFRIKAGDKFVLTGINMPDVYVMAAESWVREDGITYLLDYDHTHFTYKPEIDNLMLARDARYSSDMYDGRIMPIKDDDLGIDVSVTISSLTIKVGDSMIPQYEVTLSDDTEAELVQRAAQAAAQIMAEGGNVLTRQDIIDLITASGDRHYISKTHTDTASGAVDFKDGIAIDGSAVDRIYTGQESMDGAKDTEIIGAMKLLNTMLRKDMQDGTEYLVKLLGGIISDNMQSQDFDAGQAGAGFALYNRSDGVSYMEVDQLMVRMKAIFSELEVRKLSYMGGNILFSCAASKAVSVESTADGYKVHFNADDGTAATENWWKAGDLARCESANIKAGIYENVSNQSYWRKVIEVGDDYITLSASDCMAGSTEPKAGDSIIQLGNSTDTDRQNAIVMSVYGEGAPSIVQYEGISSYSLSGKSKTVISPKGNVFSGSFYLADGTSIFDFMEGRMMLTMSEERDDVSMSMLSNCDFSDGLNKWSAASTSAYLPLKAGGKVIAGGGIVTGKVRGGAYASDSYAVRTTDEGRNCVRIKRSSIFQSYSNFINLPAIAETQSEFPAYLLIYYRCATAGTLTCTGFLGSDTPITILSQTVETGGVASLSGAVTFDKDYNFRIAFTGDIYIYAVVLSTEKVTSIYTKLHTEVTQTAEAITALASKVTTNTKDISALKVTATEISSEVTSIKDSGDGRNFYLNGTRGAVKEDVDTTMVYNRSSLAHDWKNLLGKKVTISCTVSWDYYEADSSTNNRMGVSIGLLNGTTGYWEEVWLTPDAVTGEKRVSNTMTFPTTATAVRVAESSIQAKCTATISEIKVEIGTTATEWTDANEDSITTLSTKVSQKADEISLTALENGIATAGIDVTNHKIVLAADKTIFKDSNNNTLAIFDDNGISANSLLCYINGRLCTSINRNNSGVLEYWYDADHILQRTVFVYAEDGMSIQSVSVVTYNYDGTIRMVNSGGSVSYKDSYCWQRKNYFAIISTAILTADSTEFDAVKSSSLVLTESTALAQYLDAFSNYKSAAGALDESIYDGYYAVNDGSITSTVEPQIVASDKWFSGYIPTSLKATDISDSMADETKKWYKRTFLHYSAGSRDNGSTTGTIEVIWGEAIS